MQRKSAGVSPHEKAKAKADRLDRTFFMRHGGSRAHYIRPSLPFEFAGWGPTTHTKKGYVVVAMRGGEWVKHPFYAEQVPDPDEVCAISVFDWITKALAKVDPDAPPTILRPTAEEARESTIKAMSSVALAKYPDMDAEEALHAAARIYDRRHPPMTEAAHVG